MMQRIGKFHPSRSRKWQEGVAMVEMALFMSGLSVMIIGLIDFGYVMNADIQLSNAERIGAQVAMAQPSNSSAITSAVQNGTSLPSSSITATTDTFCECDGSGVSCSFSCAGTMATFVNITASYSVPLFAGYLGNTGYALNKSVSVRVQ